MASSAREGCCEHRFFDISHYPGETQRCVREAGHGGAHWTSKRKLTANDATWASRLNGVDKAALGMFRGDTRAYNRLEAKGILHTVHKRDRNVYLSVIRLTQRGAAWLAGEDVR